MAYKHESFDPVILPEEELDEDLLNLDEFPEEIPDLLTQPSEQEKADARPEDADTGPMRMVGWVYKKAPGKAPEVQVVEAPLVSPEPAAEEAEPVPDEPEEGEQPAAPAQPEEVPEPESPANSEDEEDLPPAWIWEKERGEEEPLLLKEEDAQAQEQPDRPKPTWSGVFRRMRDRHRKEKQSVPAEEPDSQENAAPPILRIVKNEETLSDGGADESQDAEESGPDSRPRFRRIPKPDVPPRYLAVLYGNRLSVRRRHLFIALLLTLLLLYLNLSDSLNFPVPEFMWDDGMLTAVMLEFLGLELLLLGSAFIRGILDLFRGRPGLHTLASLAVILTAADGLVVILLNREGPLPCVGCAALVLLFSALGQYMNQKAQRIACRTAAMTDQPGRLTLLHEDGQPTDLLLKYKGDAGRFGSQIQEPDGVQRRMTPLTVVLLLLGVLLMIMGSVGQEEPEMVFWCGSLIFLLSAPLSATLSYGLPWCSVSERLNRTGCALAGWDGVRTLKETRLLTVTDDDLFPTGMISCNGIQFYGRIPGSLAVGYAATLVKAAGGGLTNTFDKLVYSQGARYWTEELFDFEMREEGGYYALIHGDDVLLGSASFMSLMDISLPEGISVKTAAFCAVNGELAAQFALVYKMPTYVRPAEKALERMGYQMVLVSRDFNLTPRMLVQSFNLSMKNTQFPETTLRQELSAPQEETDVPLGAILSREGLDSHCDAVLGARLLYKVAKQNARWAGLASVLGLLLGAYLTSQRAYTALQPINVLVFMLLWLLPCLLNSKKATQF